MRDGQRVRVLGVLGAEEVDVEPAEALRAVPDEVVQVFTHRVYRVDMRDLGQGIVDDLFAGYLIILTQIVTQAGIIRVRPYRVLGVLPPRQVAGGYRAALELVPGRKARQQRVPHQDQLDVSAVRLVASALSRGRRESFHPALVDLGGFAVLVNQFIVPEGLELLGLVLVVV